MALPATDTFTTSTSQTLTAYSANWAAVTSNGLVDATLDAVRANSSSTDAFVRWAADSFANDQYCQVRVHTLSSGGTTANGPAVRMAAGATTCYYCALRFDTLVLWKIVAGTFTQIGAAAGPATTNDIIRIEAVGDQITVKKNGIVVIGPVTDSAIASGSAGMRLFSNAAGINNGYLDDFEAGNISSLTHYTLTASSGSIGLTGSAASLQYGHRLAALPGALTLTGIDASLLADRRIVADSSAFALTGIASTLEVDRRLIAAGTSFTLTGYDATLTYEPLGAYVLVADGGAYSLTGSAAILVWSAFEMPPTPIERIFIVQAENRVFTVVAENRTYLVPAESRVFELA